MRRKTVHDTFIFIFSRYPTNKWIKLGTFHGRDERNVQSFPLDEQMYAKYVKVIFIHIELCLSCNENLVVIPPAHLEIRETKRKFIA